MNLLGTNAKIFGEFSIFNTPFIFIGRTGQRPDATDGQSQEDETNYLQKGEKILSLLRKKTPRFLFSEDKVMEMIKDQWEKTLNAAQKRIGAKLEKEFIEIMEDCGNGTEAIERACMMLKEKIPLDIEIVPELREREVRTVNELCGRGQKAIINVRYKAGGKEKDFVIPVGYAFRKRYESGCRLSWDHGPYVNTRNFAKFFSELYLESYLLKKVRELRNASSSAEEYASHRVIGKYQDKIRKKNICTDYDFMVSHKKLYAEYPGLYEHIMLIYYPEKEESRQAVLEMENYDLQNLLFAFSEDYKKLKEESRMEKELSKDHAKSFQTKKNIPEKCVRAMSRSGFNQYFGYVEFDEECDLALMDELFREYNAFAKELDIQKYPEVSLRFRKLGNHKATGLYYYILKCLCVDVRSPGSMAHEVGHMLDYHLDHISIKWCFQEIYSRYEYLLKEYTRKADKAQAEVLNGKTKYNLQYYLQPTEVFARCFEMYVLRIRGVDNSICKPESGFAYPEDERLMELVRDFYDGILGTKKKEETDQADA